MQWTGHASFTTLLEKEMSLEVGLFSRELFPARDLFVGVTVGLHLSAVGKNLVPPGVKDGDPASVSVCHPAQITNQELQ